MRPSGKGKLASHQDVGTFQHPPGDSGGSPSKGVRPGYGETWCVWGWETEARGRIGGLQEAGRWWIPHWSVGMEGGRERWMEGGMDGHHQDVQPEWTPRRMGRMEGGREEWMVDG